DRAYFGLGGYPAYYGGYYGYHHHDDDAWIAVGAGIVGVLVGSVIARPPVYVYPMPPPPPAAPATQQCPDGSIIPAGSYCPEPPSPAPAPAPAPAPERGERG